MFKINKPDESTASIKDVKQLVWMAFQHKHRIKVPYPKVSLATVLSTVSLAMVLTIIDTPITSPVYIALGIVFVAALINLADWFITYEEYFDYATGRADNYDCMDEEEDYATPKYLRLDKKEKP